MQYGVLCYLVEYYTFGLFRFESQGLKQMPADGLSLAVLIGCEPDNLRLLRFLLQLRHQSLLVGWYLVVGFEVMFDVYAYPLLFQVSDMTETRQDRIVFSQEFLYGFGLRRGLDNN